MVSNKTAKPIANAIVTLVKQGLSATTHGINDNMCPYPAQGPGQLKEIAQLDGCIAMDIPTVCKP